MSSKILLLLAAAYASGGGALQMFEAVEPHMGTLVRIKLYAADADQASHAFRAAFQRIAELDSMLSDYRADSELNRLCRSEPGHPVKLGDDLFRVLSASRQFSLESDGAFDVTLGPVIRLWRQARRDGSVPDAASLAAAKSHTGFRKLHLDPDTRSATLTQAGMQLDLGGIAKGYAGDEALATIGQLGIVSALVAMSGDLAFSHAPPGQRGWKIALEPFGRVVELADAAVSTSGDAEQFHEVNGTRYSHIIDSSTGQAVTSRIAASVVARHGIDADALATTLCVLGPERGLALIEKHPDAAAIISDPASGSPAQSSRFRMLLDRR